MPKIKTHKGSAKRFKFTGNGKIRRQQAYSNHLFASKTKKRKRNLRKSSPCGCNKREKAASLASQLSSFQHRF